MRGSWPFQECQGGWSREPSPAMPVARGNLNISVTVTLHSAQWEKSGGQVASLINHHRGHFCGFSYGKLLKLLSIMKSKQNTKYKCGHCSIVIFYSIIPLPYFFAVAIWVSFFIFKDILRDIKYSKKQMGDYF